MWLLVGFPLNRPPAEIRSLSVHAIVTTFMNHFVFLGLLSNPLAHIIHFVSHNISNAHKFGHANVKFYQIPYVLIFSYRT